MKESAEKRKKIEKNICKLHLETTNRGSSVNEQLLNHGTMQYYLAIKRGKLDITNINVPLEKLISKAHFSVCNNNNHRRGYQLDGDGKGFREGIWKGLGRGSRGVM